MKKNIIAHLMPLAFLVIPGNVSSMEIKPSLTEQILTHFNVTKGNRVALKDKKGLMGYARKFEGGIGVQLRGLSQEQDMACGVRAYTNVRILKKYADYPLVQEYLLNNHYVAVSDEQVEAMIVNNLLKDKKKFPTRDIAVKHLKQKLSGQQRGGGLQAEDFDVNTLAGTLDNIGLMPPSVVQQNLPYASIYNIGSKGTGHWVAFYYEHLTDSQIGVIIVDPIQFSQGNLVDKLDAYQIEIQTQIKEIQNYLKKLDIKPQPSVELPKPEQKSELLRYQIEELTEQIVRGSPEQINFEIETLKKVNKQFSTIQPLKFVSSDPAVNDKIRADFIKTVATKVPSEKEFILEKLLKMLEVATKSNDKEKIQNCINALIQ